MDPEESGSQELENGNEAYNEPVESQQQEIADNPAWKDWLEPIPEAFHGHLKTQLSKSDKYVQEVQQKYSPYKEFVDNGVAPEQIQQWGQLAALFQNNPRGVFDYLNGQYNFIPNGDNASQGQKQSTETLELGEETNPQFDISQDPRFQQVANMAQMSVSAIQQMEQMQINQKVDAQLQTEFAQLDKDFPGIDRNEIILRAMGKASVQGKDAPADLFEAAKELQALGFGRGNRAPAPPNLSGNRALPSSQVDPGKMTATQRKNYVASLLAAQNTD